jgi:hypothetical protein
MWASQKILVLKEETAWGRFGTDKNNFMFLYRELWYNYAMLNNKRQF